MARPPLNYCSEGRYLEEGVTMSLARTRKLTRAEKLISRLSWKLDMLSLEIHEREWAAHDYPESRKYTLKERLIYRVLDILDAAEEKISDREWKKLGI